MSESRVLGVDYIARVEGEGALHLRLEDGAVAEAQLRIFEPPRFFEALLRERDFAEAPDITSRICGICPVAYLMSACQAMEAICGAKLPAELQRLRRLLYCGEWIESHTLHIHMLHLPDFLGYPDAVSLARDEPELVRRGLRLKKLGNTLMRIIGGREIHPINVRVGGFYRAPDRQRLTSLLPELSWGLQAAQDTVERVARLSFPDFERDYHFGALQHPRDYPLEAGTLASSRRGGAPVSGYERLYAERQAPYSTALHTYPAGGGSVQFGPLARYALNRDRLTPAARAAAEAAGLPAVVRNPFQSIVVRAVEVVLAVEEALRLVETYQPPAVPAVAVTPRAGTGHGATEAPRGTLYHRYTLDAEGLIRDAKIVAPTAVNQRVIEEDLAAYVAPHAKLDDAALKALCERAIRNYDPCISCSTHFLDLTVERCGGR